MVDAIFYAYLAGLVDGEGCFQLVKHKNPKIKRGFSWMANLTVALDNPEVLNYIKKTLTYGHIHRTPRYVKYHFHYKILFHSNNLRKLLPHLLLYLRAKKREASMMKEALFLLKRNRGKNCYGIFDDKLESLFEKIRDCHKISARKRRKW